MAKKISTDAPSSSLGHNPFSGLQALRAALPEAPDTTTSKSPSGETTLASTTAAKEFLDKVVVRHERKGHGGKTVTVVSGIAPAARDALCGALKKALGCGARVEGDDVVLQGELVERAMAFLQARGAKRIVRGS
jgi:translation initiation factor 1